MARLAVVGKQQTLGAAPMAHAAFTELDSVPAGIVDCGSHVALYRHGLGEYVPAQRIDHAINMRALTALGCDRILAVSSVGALRTELTVGTFLAPDDFIALDQEPVAATDGEGQHVVPGFTPDWRDRVIGAWTSCADDPVVNGGVYWQTNGPRFETPAEVRMIARFAHVVGMTLASECVAANQLGLQYAAICVVDNLANGLGAAHLTPHEYEQGQASNRDRLFNALGAVIPQLST